MLLRPPYRYSTITTGLVGWWPFDDGAVTGIQLDNSGHPQNFGTLNGGASRTTNGFGRPIRGSGGALNLVSANSQYMDAGADLSLCPAAISITLWVNSSSFPNAYNCLAIRPQNGSGSYYYAFYITSAGKLAAYLGPGGNIIDPATTAMSINKWYHLALTYNAATNLILYINGATEASLSANSNQVSVAGNLWIGGQQTTTRYCNCRMRDVRIYNRALSAAEVFAISREAYQPTLDIETIALMVSVSQAVAGQSRGMFILP